MKTKLHRLLVLLILACLSRPVSDIAFDQSSDSLQPRKKRVFSNEDLDKYQEKYGEGTLSSQSASADSSSKGKVIDAEGNKGDKVEKGKAKPDLAAWRAKLKETDDTIAKKKFTEAKLGNSIKKYSQKLAEAEGDFDKLTTQEQVDDIHRHMARIQAELKKAEEDRAKILSDAKKAGIKEEDLLKSGSSNEAK